MTSTDALAAPREDGPFVLRPLLEDVPLFSDGSQSDVKITCVEYLNRNLYVGTSASELLHFVQIPPDPSERSADPVYILASRLEPAFVNRPGSTKTGIQQILLLPQVQRACILCNGTLTFYALPELSPVFDGTQVKNCNWIGGVDQSEADAGPDQWESGRPMSVLLSLNRRIQVVRIGESISVQRKIDFPESKLSVRRDNIACVADSRWYSLLEVERQLKIPLMSISSVEENTQGPEFGHAESIISEPGSGVQRSASSSVRPPAATQVHGRSTSLGSVLNSIRGQSAHQEPGEAQSSLSGASSPLATSQSPQPTNEAIASAPPVSTDDALPSEPPLSANTAIQATPQSATAPVFLQPHILTPTPDEFLLVTGTNPLEPGIGMFVNLDGDPTRPTVEFGRYPKQVVSYGARSDLSSSRSTVPSDEESGFLLASLSKNESQHGIEIQAWDAGSKANPTKHWLESPVADPATPYGIRALVDEEQTTFEDMVDKLCQRRFTPFPSGSALEHSTVLLKSSDSRTNLSMERVNQERELFEQNFDSQDEDSLPDNWSAQRNSEEEHFTRRLAKVKTRIVVWSGRRIWWAIRNPLLIQLDAKIEMARATAVLQPGSIDRPTVFEVLDAIRGREPRTELEFVTLAYLRQKSGVLLLTTLLLADNSNAFSDGELAALEEVLVESKLDPRVVLSLIPRVRNEIIEGRRGIWIHGGVKRIAEAYLRSDDFQKRIRDPISSLNPRTVHFLRRFLSSWRRMKGFGSIADEHEVFRTVDSALLLVLLELDQYTQGGAVRVELNKIVDDGVDSFDRAVDLLESYHRLYMLSRLYQSRRMASDVLATWKRIIEGERDEGDEQPPDEDRVRDYLSKISNRSLVQEYGVWLAMRNPRLGVQVFAEEKGKTARFQPAEAVDILRQEAPDAVKYYLEHLVFGKGQNTYVNDLVGHYLDVVVGELQGSQQSRNVVKDTYDTYRALQPPKPSYSHFLRDNAPPNDEMWHSRLRLLQLLGLNHDYNADHIRTRIAGLHDKDLLVPETIILSGKARQHEHALRLLVHKLGDYDTAISYCLRGGSSIYAPNPTRRDSLPLDPSEQRHLFLVVLSEFLALEDVSARVAQTSSLLERFGHWFEIDDVLGQIPDDWSIDVVAGFLASSLRRLVRERNECIVQNALSSAQNLQVSYDLVMGREKQAVVETLTEEVQVEGAG